MNTCLVRVAINWYTLNFVLCFTGGCNRSVSLDLKINIFLAIDRAPENGVDFCYQLEKNDSDTNTYMVPEVLDGQWPFKV